MIFRRKETKEKTRRRTKKDIHIRKAESTEAEKSETSRCFYKY